MNALFMRRIIKKIIPLYLVFLLILTFYIPLVLADGGTYDYSVYNSQQGGLRKINADYDTCRNGSSSVKNNFDLCKIEAGIGGTWDFQRSVFIFDTSNLDGKNIVSAYFRAQIDSGDATTGAWLVTGKNDCSMNNVDFSDVNFTTKASDTMVNGSADVYSEWNLNANGLADIDKDGCTSIFMVTENAVTTKHQFISSDNP